jgi:hypothetical protein
MGGLWNLVRHHAHGRVGKESGGSFFMAAYGLRILNASNTCVAWDRRELHGTGRYEAGLEHIGIAILLSKDTETSWRDYKARVLNGELQEDNLLWYYGSGDGDDGDDKV